MDWLEYVFDKQVELQRFIKNSDDLENVVDMYNAATGATVEIGEMLQSDTRWKQFTTGSKKKPIVNKEQFIEEWCDVFIYMLNVLIYGGYNLNDVRTGVNNKQNKNFKRFNYD